MSSPSAKRALFSAASPRKRAKTKTVVVRAKTESKYYDQSHTTSIGYLSNSLVNTLFQGDGKSQHIGSKLRISNIEIRWDFTGASYRDFSGVIRLIVPKDPNGSVGNKGTVTVYDPTQFTVLHEIYLNPGHNMTGMYRWKGPLNVQFSGDTTNVVKNHVYLTAYTKSEASSAPIHTRVWYTDN